MKVLVRRLAVWGVIGPVLGAAGRQPPDTRYQVTHLACAHFGEAVRTRIRGESGTATVVDRAGRDGLLVVRARDSVAGLAVEAWYDSLSVWRATDTGRENPDAGGMLGGRYRGLLLSTGAYRGRAIPFVPDEVAGVADLSNVMSEFFPVLPPVELPVGRTWTDTTGLTIRRLGDRREGRQVARRFQWTGSRRLATETPVDDTLAITVDEVVREEGELLWSDALGPLSWSRHLVIKARIPPRGGVRRPMTSTIEQDVTVVRRFDLEACQ
jgi:hypothetical protein